VHVLTKGQDLTDAPKARGAQAAAAGIGFTIHQAAPRRHAALIERSRISCVRARQWEFDRRSQMKRAKSI